MAEQLNLISNERIVATALHQEMQRSYLEYAMSVIVGRALPDVRDGLKPVQRRILYAMHELGLLPDRPFRKCARVVGDVLGKYHPHGDQAVYDALVRLVQDFSCRYPLLAGHGNFGSIDNDPPAAMRYTETRLAPIGNEALLGEIGDNTVEFVPNFDNSQQEPVVLPAQLPFLILNGCTGIAVGMATNIPPHNLGEVVDGLIALIDRPQLTPAELLEIIPGPDFPTGGEIVGTSGIEEAYTKGKGSIPLRGVATQEEIQPGRGRHRRSAIVVTEIPYQVNKAAWIEKVAELVNQGRIEGIADIRDESDRDGIRVVIELKREGNPHQILQQLYQKTPLQTNFGAILLALVDNQPRQLTLKELLEAFLQFREETLTRRYRYELDQAERRQEVVNGLLIALNHIDEVIDILRQSRDGSSAKAQLQVTLDLTERQADAILAMPLRRLTGIERENLEQEAAELQQKIEELQTLLGNRRELLKALKKDLRTFKRKYATPRRTRIQTEAEVAQAVQAQAAAIETQQSDETVVMELTQRGYGRRLSPRSFQRQAALEPSSKLEEFEDFPLQQIGANLSQELVLFTRQAKAFSVKVGQLSATSRRNPKGTPLITLLPEELQGNPEEVATAILTPPEGNELDLIALTDQGRIKRLPLGEFQNLSSRGLTLMKLKEGDWLKQVLLRQPSQHLVLATSKGRLLRFEVNDEQLPCMGRTAQGVLAMRLGQEERVIGATVVTLGQTPDSARESRGKRPKAQEMTAQRPATKETTAKETTAKETAAKAPEDIVLISEKGYFKRIPASLLPEGDRGGLGKPLFKFELKNDVLAVVQAVTPGELVTVLSEEESEKGDRTQRIARFAVNQIPIYGKEGGGERLLQPRRNEKIVSVAVLPTSLDLS